MLEAVYYPFDSHSENYEGKKGKAVPQHTYGGTGGERRYSSYSFTTSALDGG
jgi:hypothetical protein